MKRNNSILAVTVSQEIVAQGETFFVPGVGEVQATDLKDVKRKLSKQPKKKVEAGDGNE